MTAGMAGRARWSALVAPAFAIMAVGAIATGRPGSALEIALQGGLLLVLGWLAPRGQRPRMLLLLALLSVGTFVAWGERAAISRRWSHDGERSLSGVLGVVPRSGPTYEGGATRYRGWTLPADAPRQGLRITFQARSLPGARWRDAWDVQGSDVLPAPLPDVSEDAVQFTAISGVALRTVHTSRPVSERSFEMELRYRGQGCATIGLGARGRGDRNTTRVCGSDDWSTLTLGWTARADSEQPEVALSIARLDGTMDIADVEVRVLGDREATRLEPLHPQGVRVLMSWPGRTWWRQPHVAFVPDTQWTDYEFLVEQALPEGTVPLTSVLEVAPGGTVQLRDVSVTARDGTAASPRFLPARQRIGFYHPNAAGHSMAALAVAVAVTGISAGAFGPTLVALLAATALTFLTGSRIAFVVAAAWLAFAMFATLRPRWRRRDRASLGRRANAVAVVFGLIVAVALLLAGVFDRSGDVPSRPDIWASTARLAADHMPSGVDTAGFAVWKSPLVIDGTGVAHGHNLWLHLAASYGWTGLVGSLWLSLGALLVSLRSGSALAVAGVVTLLLMNVVDVSLFLPAVVFALAIVTTHPSARAFPRS